VKLLLDAHTFIWWDSEPERLSPRVLALLNDESNTPYISVVNIWEIQIKSSIGKMSLHQSLENIVRSFAESDIPFLPITTSHVLALKRLPDHHRDPFDRILIAQALVEGMTLISKDAIVAQYPINVIW
jgi:PIN domain nuclease of toxin-antitoxin system